MLTTCAAAAGAASDRESNTWRVRPGSARTRESHPDNEATAGIQPGRATFIPAARRAGKGADDEHDSDGGPAFATTDVCSDNVEHWNRGALGLSKREYFAAKAMAAIITTMGTDAGRDAVAASAPHVGLARTDRLPKIVTRIAIDYATELLAALAQRPAPAEKGST